MPFDFDGAVVQAARVISENSGWEEVTYHCSQPAVQRPILALVDRHHTSLPIPQTPAVMTTKCVVTVLNDAENGISRQELDTGRAELEFPVKVGVASSIKRHRVIQVVGEDAGMISMEVR